MAVEPLSGRRSVELRERRTRTDWPHFVRDIARRWALRDRFEFIYTPKHDSWLNMAEIELNVLIRQCLDRRIDNIAEMRAEIAAWQRARNNARSQIDRQFTSRDARIKLKRPYPTLQT
jgi:hypothetical protein